MRGQGRRQGKRPDPDTPGGRLLARVEKVGIGQNSLAKRLRVHRATVWKVIQGKIAMSPAFAAEAAGPLQTTPSHLLFGSGEPEAPRGPGLLDEDSLALDRKRAVSEAKEVSERHARLTAALRAILGASVLAGHRIPKGQPEAVATAIERTLGDPRFDEWRLEPRLDALLRFAKSLSDSGYPPTALPQAVALGARFLHLLEQAVAGRDDARPLTPEHYASFADDVLALVSRQILRRSPGRRRE